jgi:hypothetical protein
MDTHGLALQQALGERTSVVCTRGPDREQVVAVAGEQRWLSMRVARQHFPIGDGGEWNAQGELGSGEFDLVVAHAVSRGCVADAVIGGERPVQGRTASRSRGSLGDLNFPPRDRVRGHVGPPEFR